MSVLNTDLIFYSVASIPTDDASTSGGAIDTTKRVALTHFTANAKLSLTSDGTDTRSVTIVGRLADGTVATENVTLTSAVEVLSVNTYSRILSVSVTANATRTVTLKQGAGGSTVGSILPNDTGRHIQFQKSSSASTTQVRYEKQFAKNTNGTNALLSAQVTLTADGQTSVIQIGLATAVNDTVSVANRLTAPSSVTFSGVGVALNVPGTDLAAGGTIGVWIQQTLTSNLAASTNSNGTFTLQLAGSTT